MNKYYMNAYDPGDGVLSVSAEKSDKYGNWVKLADHETEIASLRQQFANSVESAWHEKMVSDFQNQIEELKVNHKAELVMRDQNSQMYLDNTRQQLQERERLLAESQEVAASSQAREKVLRDAASRFYDGSNEEVGALTIALKAALSMPSDSTALEAALKESYELGRQQQQLSCDLDNDSAIKSAVDTATKQAKREALLDAAEWVDDGFYGSSANTTANALRSMAGNTNK